MDQRKGPGGPEKPDVDDLIFCQEPAAAPSER